MREINFRGRRKDNGEWEYGFYGELTDGETTKSFIMKNTLSFVPNKNVYFTDYEVDPETVGQYTGLKDKNGKEIYEGDLWIARPHGAPYIVKWHDTGWCLYRERTKLYEIAEGLKFGMVIGNIHEHPNLLQEATK